MIITFQIELVQQGTLNCSNVFDPICFMQQTMLEFPSQNTTVLTAVYLMERYCLSILTHASEIWNMTMSEYRKIILFGITALCDILYKCLRNTLTYLLTYLTALEKYSIVVGVKVYQACNFIVVVSL